MKLRQLQFFLTLADELGFGRAAEKLHVAQPSLSVQIKALEEEVGARLFERDRHHVHLTQAGKRFQEHARKIIALAETAKVEARCAEAGEVGSVALGYTASSMFSRVLPHVIRRFRDEHRNVLLSLHELTSLEQLHRLLDRSLDLGVLRKPDVATPLGLQITEWYRTPLLVAIAHDHPLARRPLLSVRDLRAEPFVTYPREAGTGIYWQVVELCAMAGFRPRVVREVLESSTIIGLVAAGVGVAIVPADINCIRFEGVEYKKLSDSQAVSSLYVAQRQSDPSEHLRALCGMLMTGIGPARKISRRARGSGTPRRVG
jgi:DNA-binding transcriptional LysR family regulator